VLRDTNIRLYIMTVFSVKVSSPTAKLLVFGATSTDNPGRYRPVRAQYSAQAPL
jgi:hypothetical protein